MGYIPPNFLDYTAIFRSIFKSVFSLLWGNSSKYLLVNTLDYNWLKTAAADFLFDNKSQWIWAKNSGASKRYKMATTAIAATRWRSQKYFLRLKSLLLQKHEMSVIICWEELLQRWRRYVVDLGHTELQKCTKKVQ